MLIIVNFNTNLAKKKRMIATKAILGTKIAD